jgi:hypothetical protein
VDGDVSIRRLHVLRLLFALNFLYLGAFVWSELLTHADPWDPVRGVAYSFWAALSLLSGLGVRYPLKMLPVLLMQLVYKSIWLLAIYLPTGSDGGSGLLTVMLGGIIGDVIVIPWSHVLDAYVRAPGNRWR